MNFAAIAPRPTIQINKPIKVTARGNMYRINIAHSDQEGNNIKNYELWTTKEAVQKHFENSMGNPHEYELKKFARINYEKQMRTHNGVLPHTGILVTTDSVTHGDPKLWPHTLSHPEIKL